MYLVVLLSIAVHSCYLGSKVVVSLLALGLGASQFTVGVLAAFYALVPLLLGVYSGRLADTVGMRMPMLIGAACTGFAMLIGFIFPSLAGLFAVSLLMGAGFVLFNVSIQNLAGGFGRPESRARNFSLLSIGYSVSAFFGPTFAGFSIDYAGHAATFGFFALFPLIPIGVLIANDRVTRIAAPASAPDERSTLALLADGPLRRVIITSGLCVAANELFAFYLPVYGHSIGLSASTTGIVLGTYALAAFVTRFMLPVLLRRLGTERVMVSFMLLAAAAFVFLPFTAQAPLLMALAFVIGIGLGVAQPVLMMVSYERSPPGRTGEVTGLRLTANNVARVTIPLVSGALGALLGAAPVFLLNALNLTLVSYIARK
jgi:MFS family permease